MYWLFRTTNISFSVYILISDSSHFSLLYRFISLTWKVSSAIKPNMLARLFIMDLFITERNIWDFMKYCSKNTTHKNNR